MKYFLSPLGPLMKQLARTLAPGNGRQGVNREKEIDAQSLTLDVRIFISPDHPVFFCLLVVAVFL